ncbi:MAG: hypothetical protein AAF725_06080 [Acidobacteriota bacterium]
MTKTLGFDKETLKTIAGDALQFQLTSGPGEDGPAGGPLHLAGTAVISAASGAVVTAVASAIGSAVGTMVASGPGSAAAGAGAGVAKSALFGAAAGAVASGYLGMKS